ncbi:MAG: nucleotidyltransferase domain-containing protein [Anaerolineales bacterium]|nr:nucleotidyltransferase domain-containing protein [Anaerolineales bacterium]
MSKTIDWSQTESIWADEPNIIAAWAFGSAQEGTIRDSGDIDIGILVESAPSLNELTRLLSRLQEALQFEDIDLVVLNDANPILRFEALSGRSLFCRDLSRRAEFASLTAREYEDAMAFFEWGLKQRPSKN